LELFEVQK